MSDGLSYADAGVDLDAAERTKEGLKELVASTRDRFTLSELGAFGGLFDPETLAVEALCNHFLGWGASEDAVTRARADLGASR